MDPGAPRYYRLALFPATDRPDLVLWALWSRNRNQEIEGGLQPPHGAQLLRAVRSEPREAPHDGCNGIRRNSEIPGILVLHFADIPESDVKTARGFKFTRPRRAILDLIELGTVERNFIRQALRQAVDRVLVTRQQIRNTPMSASAREFVEDVLRRAA